MQINGQPLIYFDNAATSQKPQQVIDAIVNYCGSFTRSATGALPQSAVSNYARCDPFAGLVDPPGGTQLRDGQASPPDDPASAVVAARAPEDPDPEPAWTEAELRAALVGWAIRLPPDKDLPAGAEVVAWELRDRED